MAAQVFQDIDDIRIKLKEIQDSSIDQLSDSALIYEASRVEAEIASINSANSSNIDYKEASQRFADFIKAMDDFSAKVKDLNCEINVNNLAVIGNERDRIIVSFISYYTNFVDKKVDFSKLQLPLFKIGDAEACQDIQKYILSDSYKDKVTKIVDNISKYIFNNSASQQQINEINGQLLIALKNKQKHIQNRISSGQAQLQVVGYLPYIVAILSFAGVATMAVIKIFDREIQIEWVVSGQITQFVTILVILSVIVALGLSNVLKEQVLGTLLGGIAGYVLAQGVGTVRDARKKTVVTENKPTPPSGNP